MRRLHLACISVLALAAASCAGAATPPAHSARAAATPRAPASAAGARPLTSADVDALLAAEWQRRGVTPSAPADDATFLRRVSIDIVGSIPSAERVVAFAADPAPSKDKRARVVAELLASDAYADHMTIVWEDLLLGAARAGEIDRAALRVWLHDQFAKSRPWNEIALSLVAGTGVQSPGKLGGAAAEVERAMAAKPEVNGAVNYALRFRDAPQDFAGHASKTFIGTQIQCAQCHDHKTEKWTQDEFRRFAACFARIDLERIGVDSKGGRIVEVKDGARPSKKVATDPDLAPIASAEPRALDGAAISGNTRAGIAKWMIANPSFARAFVNRTWAHFLGRGFVNPVDDMRPSNPPDAPALLDRIAEDFVRSGYDIKRLVTLVTATEAYQLAPAPAGGAGAGTNGEIALWSRFRVVPLGAEELASSLLVATGADAPLARRAALEDVRYKLTRFFSFAFDVDEDVEQTHYEGTLAQALLLINGQLTQFGSTAQGNNLVGAVAKPGLEDGARIEALFVRTLSRKPTASELETLTRYLANGAAGVDAPPIAAPPASGAAPKGVAIKGRGKSPLGRLRAGMPARDPKTAALEDIAWALLNSSEFVLNH